MGKEKNVKGMLAPYRVLDLTDEKGHLAGKLLADFGADVIKIEKPGGDASRMIGPFYHDEPDPEKSLFWWAYNTSKRGITLDIETTSGQEIIKQMVHTADFLIESFSPGYMGKLGLGYSELEKLNPGLIMISITPFGQTGRYKNYRDSAMVCAAMGGVMDQFEDVDRPPTWIGHHSQGYLLGSMEAAGGAMMALYYRGTTGKGQHVDVSIQEAVGRQPSARKKSELAFLASLMTPSKKDVEKSGKVEKKGRTGGGTFVQPTRIRRIWPCKDGYVILLWWAGINAKRWNMPLVNWIDSDGMAGYLKEFDWDDFNWSTVTQDEIDRMEEPTLEFFRKYTKAEILEGALKFKAMVYPVSTSVDTLQNVQLKGRNFWEEVEHPELGKTITYPGNFGIFSETPAKISRRAPLIGEHNKEIYGKELGLSSSEILALKQSGVI
jgi:crotonobetainyl-CoA:carnitine CoA-transferase CaiB-like acyl-CoA transferase